MSENLTGKYLDGAGLSKVWEKVKSYSSSNYLPLGGGDISGDLRVGGTLNASGTLNVDNKIVVGTPTSTLATDSVVTDPGGLNSGIISYVPAYFTSGANCTTLTTDSIIVNNKTGFLKADGTVDDNSYLPLTGGATDFLISTKITVGDFGQISGGENDGIDLYVIGSAYAKYFSAMRVNLSGSITSDNQATTKKYVDDKVSTAISSLNEVLKFKGSINSTSALPTSAELGWTYVVSEEGTYAGEVCEVGDMIICTTASTTDPTWTIIQRNIPGVMSNDEIDSICAC